MCVALMFRLARSRRLLLKSEVISWQEVTGVVAASRKKTVPAKVSGRKLNRNLKSEVVLWRRVTALNVGIRYVSSLL